MRHRIRVDDSVMTHACSLCEFQTDNWSPILSFPVPHKHQTKQLMMKIELVGELVGEVVGEVVLILNLLWRRSCERFLLPQKALFDCCIGTGSSSLGHEGVRSRTSVEDESPHTTRVDSEMTCCLSISHEESCRPCLLSSSRPVLEDDRTDTTPSPAALSTSVHGAYTCRGAL